MLAGWSCRRLEARRTQGTCSTGGWQAWAPELVKPLQTPLGGRHRDSLPGLPAPGDFHLRLDGLDAGVGVALSGLGGGLGGGLERGSLLRTLGLGGLGGLGQLSLLCRHGRLCGFLRGAPTIGSGQRVERTGLQRTHRGAKGA